MIRLAVFGKPISQSLSPRIHSLFARQCGLDIEYQAIEAGPGSFSDRLEQFLHHGGTGCNITMPLKGEAWRLAKRCSDNAARAEAVNTLVLESEKDWFGDNTDGGGLVNDLQRLRGRLEGSRVCLLGAGGAAAGVLAALLKAGPDTLVIVNRTREKAQRLQQRHADLGEIVISAPADLDSTAPFDLLINATSLGHRGEAPALSASWLRAGGMVYDMNYGAAAKALESVCSEQAVPYSDGLGMLVGQAALSFEIWTGQAPGARDVLEQLRREI